MFRRGAINLWYNVFMGLEQGHLSRAQVLKDKVLPHGEKFMFLGDVEILEPGKKVRGRLVDRTRPEFPYLADHLPGYPIFPGALSLEALAELSGIAVISNMPSSENKIGTLRKAEIEWKQPIMPEDVIDLEAEVIFFRMNMGGAKVKAIKNGEIAVEGKIIFMIGDKRTQAET